MTHYITENIWLCYNFNNDGMTKCNMRELVLPSLRKERLELTEMLFKYRRKFDSADRAGLRKDIKELRDACRTAQKRLETLN